MTPTKTKLLTRALCTGGALLLAAAPLARCGTDPTGSRVASFDPPQGGTEVGNARYAFDYNSYAQRTFIRDEEVLQKIAADLQQLDQGTRLTTRYFTITNLYNAGASDKDLDIARAGLSKLLNSMSYQSEIKNPTPIDAEKTVLRIDLRDYGWRRSFWDEVVRRDPYAFVTGSSLERTIQRATGVARLAHVRADWFAFAGSQGDIYHFIMGIPRNVRGLEFQLGVDRDRNIRAGRVLRAGFNGSGVSQQNRMLEWHQSRFGSYWISYDFKPSDGRSRRNLFEFPLDDRNFRGGGFDHAGGEIIYTLPNGLQGYILINNNDQRIDKAPVDIVGDNERPDKAVTNGLSCHRCHVDGMLPATDAIRAQVEKNAFAYTRAELEFVRGTYADQATLDAQLARDTERYKQAMAKIGSPIKADPITVLANAFEAELPPSAVAAELGLTTAELQTRLARDRLLTRRVGVTMVGAKVKREIYEDNFAFLLERLGLGRAFFRVGSFNLNGSGSAYSADAAATDDDVTNDLDDTGDEGSGEQQPRGGD